jgi:hypothetical protein
VPSYVPAFHTRREQFDIQVAEAVAHLVGHSPELVHTQVVVAEIPDADPGGRTVPLGAVDRSTLPPRVVLYRAPLMQRGGTAALTRDVLAELAADVLVRQPEQLDPHYPRL